MADSDRDNRASRGPQSVPQENGQKWGQPLAIVAVPLALMVSATLVIPGPEDGRRVKWPYPAWSSASTLSNLNEAPQAQPGNAARSIERRTATLLEGPSPPLASPRPARRGFSPVRERPPAAAPPVAVLASMRTAVPAGVAVSPSPRSQEANTTARDEPLGPSRAIVDRAASDSEHPSETEAQGASADSVPGAPSEPAQDASDGATSETGRGSGLALVPAPL
jgi:hypothetical protein